jgi:pyruvate dehydrogenase E2 component (dihydrolipoamide acetyltransferase)
MPKLGLTMTEGLIASWLKKEGDAVKKGEGLLEIETEKLTNVIEAPVDGTLLRILGEVGSSLPIAAVLAYIGDPGEKIPEGPVAEAAVAVAAAETVSASAPVAATIPDAATAPASGKSGRIKASPAARALAKNLGIDYTLLTGTGPGGRIVKEDVLAAQTGGGFAAARSTSAPATVQTLPYAGMRKAIGDGMHRSWSAAPMVTHHVQADVTALLDLKDQLNSDLAEGESRIGVVDLFAKIVARAIRDFPIVNATLADGEIKIPSTVNIGIAVAIDNGLVVPVVKDTGGKDLFAVSREIKELTAKARNNRLSRDEMSGGTFTISSIGGYGSVDFFTPIINQPESAILGICRTQETPVVRDGEIVIRKLAGLSLTFDHRVIDGAPAAEFLAAILKYLEKPLRALFEG